MNKRKINKAKNNKFFDILFNKVFTYILILLLFISQLLLIIKNKNLRNQLINSNQNQDSSIYSDCSKNLKIMELIFNHVDSINYNDASFNNWKFYQAEGFNFKYPPDWGIANDCETETKISYVGLGLGYYKYPYRCGTANLPSPVEFYYQDNYKIPTNYRILREFDLSIDNIKSKSYIYVIRDRSKSGPVLYNDVVIPLKETNLITHLDSSENFMNYKDDFYKILSSVKIESK